MLINSLKRPRGRRDGEILRDDGKEGTVAEGGLPSPDSVWCWLGVGFYTSQAQESRCPSRRLAGPSCGGQKARARGPCPCSYRDL